MDIVQFLQLGIGRWVHILAGIMWIGLLYYFNFVQVGALKAAAADNTAVGITRHVAPRALYYFRVASVVTWLAGAIMLGSHFFDALGFRNPVLYPIGVGAWVGTLMLVNVHAFIWPNQKKILGIVAATDEQKVKARRIAFLFSRLNTMLSIPLVFFMIASGGVFRTPMF